MEDQSKEVTLTGHLRNDVLARIPKEKQEEILARYGEEMLKAFAEKVRKLDDSELADREIDNFLQNINRLDTDKKYYQAKAKFQTPSSTQEYNVKGGDTRFIIPILLTVAAIIIAIAFAMFKK